MDGDILKQIQAFKDEKSEYYVKPDEYETEDFKCIRNPVKKLFGIYMPNAVVNVSNFRHMTVRHDDTFILGFQKSGTTWMEEIIWLLRNKFDFEKSKQILHFFRVLWLDQGFPLKFLDELPSPRIFKSHLPINLLPENFNKTAKVVYMVRNPKDALISYFNFFKSLKNDEFIGTIDDMVDVFVEGKTLFGSWWDHLNQYTHLENVHFVHYEDLIEKPIETISELASYLGVEFNLEQIKQLVEYTTFDNMKNSPSFDPTKLPATVNFVKEDFQFFSKGKVGNWKNYLTEEHSKRIDQVVNQNLIYKKPIRYE